MAQNPNALLIEPEALEADLGAPDLLVVDLSRPETYAQGHIPGAVHLDYTQIIAASGPVKGLLPDAGGIARLLSGMGATPQTRVVSYDDEGGGRAARMLWTLAAYGHRYYALLNGGLHAWANEGHPLQGEIPEPRPSDYRPAYDGSVVADAAYIHAHLEDPGVVLLDTRSAEEYRGTDRRAARGGHIPGAVHMEWTEAMDRDRNLRLKDPDWLVEQLASRGITRDKEVITYCQTHHRSAHTWLWLQHLGFDRAKGYPGAWSEWGNRSDLPVEG